ncbi:hypothetical protein CT676_27805 [Bradyrhizobium sp. MOS001]|uniref:hypothetical protein n=1 Tax=Bradyrhizobium sp. MOS001 TaxID=2133948 RepID=UPI0010751EC9|nr:hypothetical protein [Bradyrhizobium sp. MOS001]TFW57811.1 hypothetical protein CT676_27805 [Bradyrhizobium sp. MOS001]
MKDISLPPAGEAAAPNFELESIMQRIGRPVFAVMGGKVDLDHTSAEDSVWNARLQQATAVIGPSQLWVASRQQTGRSVCPISVQAG